MIDINYLIKFFLHTNEDVCFPLLVGSAQAPVSEGLRITRERVSNNQDSFLYQNGNLPRQIRSRFRVIIYMI